MKLNVRLRIHYDRRSDLAAALTLLALTASFLGYLAWGRYEAIAAGLPAVQHGPLGATADMRQFYLSAPDYDGSQALSACAGGYHMASLWEIVDVSGLRYNTTLGAMLFDSGQGPPATYTGWVRTGHESDTQIIPGEANCAAWTSSSNAHYGTSANLPGDWTAGSEDLQVWNVEVVLCPIQNRVWCIEDAGYSTYLPVVLKNW